MNRNRSKIEIVLTGGHAATTALSVIEELKARGDRGRKWEIVWIGPKYAIEDKRVPTLASIELPKKGVKCYSIITGKIQRKISWRSLLSLLKIPLGFIHATLLIRKIRPVIILSFGGYAAFPVVTVGWVFRIPVLLHDQTYSFNRANKMLSPFATKIALSRKKSLRYYPGSSSIVTGNPIMRSITKIKPKMNKSVLPTIYITGGSTGAQSINSLILIILKRLLQKYKVIHQVGLLDYKKFLKIKREFPKRLAANYKVHKNLSPEKVSSIYIQADIIVSRAGANTVSEIIAIRRPAILIPLIIGKWDEQKKNAYYAKRFGIARVFTQEGLTGDKLFNEIEAVNKEWKSIVNKVKDKESPDLKASQKLVDILGEVIVK